MAAPLGLSEALMAELLGGEHPVPTIDVSTQDTGPPMTACEVWGVAPWVACNAVRWRAGQAARRRCCWRVRLRARLTLCEAAAVAGPRSNPQALEFCHVGSRAAAGRWGALCARHEVRAVKLCCHTQWAAYMESASRPQLLNVVSLSLADTPMDSQVCERAGGGRTGGGKARRAVGLRPPHLA